MMKARSDRLPRRMPWTVSIKERAIDDLRWFGDKLGQLLLRTAMQQLGADPDGL